MKYLKRIDEARIYNFTDDDLINCFIDLTDYDFIVLVDCDYRPAMRNYHTIPYDASIKISKDDSSFEVGTYGASYFCKDDVIETLMFAIPYIKTEYNLELAEISAYLTPSADGVWTNGKWVDYTTLEGFLDEFKSSWKIKTIDITFNYGVSNSTLQKDR